MVLILIDKRLALRLFQTLESASQNLAVWQPFMLHLRIEIITKEVSKEVMNFDGVGLVRYSVLGRKTIFF